MLKGMEFRIYSNKIQETIIQKTFGCSRVVYNSGLALRIKEYKNGNSIGYKETNSILTSMGYAEPNACGHRWENCSLRRV